MSKYPLAIAILIGSAFTAVTALGGYGRLVTIGGGFVLVYAVRLWTARHNHRRKSTS